MKVRTSLSRHHFSLLSTFLMLALSTATHGAVPVWQQQINVAVDEYMNQWSETHAISEETSISYKMAPQDSRLNLTPCDQTPGVKSGPKPRGSKMTARVSCPSPSAWQLYVTIDISRSHPVVVLDSSVPRGTALTMADLDLKRVDLGSIRHGYFTDPEDALGMIAKRALNAGNILTPSQVSPPKLVHKGDSVIIVARSGGFSVKMPGKAMSDGRKGQQIIIKNTSSQRMVKATVLERGLVQVPM